MSAQHRRRHVPRVMKKPCPTPGCPELVTSGKCEEHRRQADQHRGTAAERGYTSVGHFRFRDEVLARDPICVLCMRRPSQEADHFPVSRKGLITLRLNPDDPKRGRGLCKPCHSAETARHQPGGWNRPQ